MTSHSDLLNSTTVLQAGRTQAGFSMVSMEFFTDYIATTFQALFIATPVKTFSHRLTNQLVSTVHRLMSIDSDTV